MNAVCSTKNMFRCQHLHYTLDTLFLDWSILKMEEVRTSETSVTLYKTHASYQKHLNLNRDVIPNIGDLRLVLAPRDIIETDR